MPGLHYSTAHGALYGYSTACTGLGAAAGENERGFSVCDMDNDIYQIVQASFPDLLLRLHFSRMQFVDYRNLLVSLVLYPTLIHIL